jgi:hypothetical protein
MLEGSGSRTSTTLHLVRSTSALRRRPLDFHDDLTV